MRIFASETEREIESLTITMKIQLLIKSGLERERVKDTVRSLRERYGMILSNVFFFDSNGKIYYSHPKEVNLEIPYRSFSQDRSVESVFFRDKDGDFKLYIFYPYFKENEKFYGGIGVEVNLDSLRNDLKKVLDASSNIIILDTLNSIVSADDKKICSQNFLQYLSSMVDEPESVSHMFKDIVKINEAKIFSTRLYKDSRRVLLAIAVAPVNLNGNRFIICDYRFHEEFLLYNVVSSLDLLFVMLSGFSMVVGIVLVLYLNFRFSNTLSRKLKEELLRF